MKWKSIAITAIISLFLILIYIWDWNNSLLKSSGYKLFTSDSDHAWIVRNDDKSVFVGDKVVDFKIIGDYIFILRMIAESRDCRDEKDFSFIVTHYSDVREFWIGNRTRHEEYGPMDERAFSDWLTIHQIPNMSLHAPKSYRPSSMELSETFAKCM